MATPPIRLAVVDDHHMVRRGLSAMLDEWPKGQVVLQAEHGLAYEQGCAEVGHIHIAFVDLRMPVRDGYETIQWIVRNQPRTLPMAISVDPHPVFVQRAVRAGARGFICKNTLPPELFRAMDNLLTAGFHYNAYITKALRRSWEDADAAKHPDAIIASLSPREKEFLLLYARPPFPSLADVAVRMGLTESGAESLRKAVRDRSGCSTREEMIDLVYRAGLR